VDLLKPVDLLVRAYDDALGVTAAFNRNILRQANRLLGTDFDPTQWRHVALFNEVHSRVEMHLEARQSVTVRWENGSRRFKAGERIHTESAHKYTVERFAALLRQAGFATSRHWTDPNGHYAVFHALA
jgi:L-histidine N-alpha-methyltransferase